jgi:hypothetical protein
MQLNQRLDTLITAIAFTIALGLLAFLESISLTDTASNIFLRSALLPAATSGIHQVTLDQEII